MSSVEAPASASSTLRTRRSGLAERNWKPRSRFVSAGSRLQGHAAACRPPARRRNGGGCRFPRRRPARRPCGDPARCARCDARPPRGPPGSARPPWSWRRVRDRWTRPGAARTGCGRRARRAAAHRRVRYGATSTSAPAPAPPREAMSTKVTVAGVCLRGENIPVNRSSRASGTRASPTLASSRADARPPVPVGRVRSWNSVVLPAEASPIRPARNMVAGKCRTTIARTAIPR